MAISFSKESEKKTRLTLRKVLDQKWLIIMSFPFVIWLAIFRYIPLSGWAMAFVNYKPKKGIFGSDFVGLSYFKRLFGDQFFLQSLTNTLGMSILGILFNTFFAIIFALLLNELRNVAFKKTVQTISYLPHFVSWVVISGIVTSMLNYNGTINDLLVSVGIIETGNRIQFLQNENYFWWVVVFSDLWKETGWNAIIYLAAITGIDTSLYEAAKVDGANRLKQIWHITLPGIRGTIIVLFIMGIGGILNIGFEKQMLLSNSALWAKAKVIDWYALDFISEYSYGTAIGIFKSVVGVTLMVIANNVSKKFGEGTII